MRFLEILGFLRGPLSSQTANVFLIKRLLCGSFPCKNHNHNHTMLPENRSVDFFFAQTIANYMLCARRFGYYSMQRCNFLQRNEYIHHLITHRPTPTTCNESNRAKNSCRKCFDSCSRTLVFDRPFNILSLTFHGLIHIVIFFRLCVPHVVGHRYTISDGTVLAK